MSVFSRRKAMVGAAFAAFAGGAAAAVPAEAASPDAELIQACKRYLDAEAEYRRRVNEGEENGEDDPYICDVVYVALLNTVAYTSATTLAGIKAKAMAIIAHYSPDPPGNGDVMEDGMWNLLHDLAEVQA